MNEFNFNFLLEKDTLLVFGALLLIALTALFSERAGIINIALEGQLVAGVFGYTIVGFFTRHWAENLVYLRLTLSVLCAFFSIFVVTLFFAFFVINVRINQILVGVAMNILVTALATFFVFLSKSKNELNTNTDYVSLFQNIKTAFYWVIPIQNTGDVPVSLEIFIPLFLLLASLPVIYLFFYRTTPGLRIRACGENAKVVKLSGLSVIRYRYLALFVGVFFMVGASIFFVEAKPSFSGTVGGFGYIGLAMLILGNRNLILIFIFTFLFSLFYRLSITLNEVIFAVDLQEFGQELWRSTNYILPIICLIIYGLIQRKRSYSSVPEGLGVS